MLTSVADVYVIYATAPFITAGVAWVVLREKGSWSVLAARYEMRSQRALAAS